METLGISQPLREDFIRHCLPFMQTEAERRKILSDALGDDSPDLREIKFIGSAESFLQNLLQQLATKEAYPGRNALVAIVSYLRKRADSDTLLPLQTLEDALSKELENYQPFSEANLVFISHASQDNAIATRIAKDLNRLGLKVWIDDERLQGGHHWRSEIFRGLRNAESVIVLLTRASISRPWVQREVSSAFLLRKKIFPLLIEDVFSQLQNEQLMPELLDVQGIDFKQHQDEGHYGDALQNLHRALMRRDKEQSPFRGLQNFEAIDSEIFFGREAESAELRRQLLENRQFRLSVITGASGTGKSSVMRAGMVSAFIPGSTNYSEAFRAWRYSLLRFTKAPYHAFAEVLHDDLPEQSIEQIARKLQEKPQYLFEYVDEILKTLPKEAQYVFFIDQFEELFRFQTEALAVLDMLDEAIRREDGRIYLVLTIRADFFPQLTEHPGISQILNEAGHLRIISHMSRENLLRTIVEPAAAVDLVYQPGLANRILDDATAQAGALPLLEYSLQQLYEQREGRSLTIAAYERMGGLKQALARHAESVYENLSPAQQRLLRRLMLDLLTVSPEQIVTRLRRQIHEIQFKDFSDDELRYLIDYLLSEKARLLTMSRTNTESGDELAKQILSIELAHEALLTEWERLHDWIAESRVLLVQRERYERLAREWRNSNHAAADLLRDANLLEAVRWLRSSEASSYLSREVSEFIHKSLHYDAQLWDESGHDVDLLVGSQLEFLQHILQEAAEDAAYIEPVLRDFLAESQLAEANPYHRNAIQWTRDQDPSALNIALEPAQQWIENPLNQSLISEMHREFFEAAFSLRAVEWEKNQRSREFLLKRHEIDRMQYLLSNKKQDWYISTLVQEYLATSELEYQRRQRIQRLVTVVITVLAFAAGFLAYLSNQRAEAEARARQEAETQRNIAIEQSQIAQSRQFAVQSQLALEDGNLQLAFLLGLEAYQLAETSDALSSLLSALQFSPQLDRYLLASDIGLRAMSFNPDHSLILLGTEEGSLLSFNPENKALETLLPLAHEGAIWNLAYLNNGSQILTLGADGWARLWNSNGELLREVLRDEVGGAYALALHPAQPLVAIGGDDGLIYLWDYESDSLTSLNYHQDTIYSLEFSPDATLLAAASADGVISLWDTSNWDAPQLLLEGHSNWVLDITFTPDSRLLASAGADRLVKIWALSTGQELSSMDNHSDWVRQLVFNADGSYLISASDDKSIIIWDIQNPALPIPLTGHLLGHQETIYSLLLNDMAFLSAGDDGQLIQWQLEPQLALGQIVLQEEGFAYDSVFNPEGNLLISTNNNRLFFSDAATLQAVRDPAELDTVITSLDFASQGTRFALGTEAGTVAIWDAVLGRETSALQSHTQAVYEIAFSPDGKFLASAGEDRSIVLHNLDTETELILRGHSDRINALAFSPDGQILASAGHEQTIHLWDTATGTELRVLPEIHSRPIEALAFSSDGKELLSASRDNSILIWEPETAIVLGSLNAHAGSVNSLSVSGDWLASGGSDGDLILWSISNRRLIGRFSEDAGKAVLSVQFSPDGNHIIASYDEGTVILWESAISDWESEACERISRSLSEAERHSYGLVNTNTLCNQMDN